MRRHCHFPQAVSTLSLAFAVVMVHLAALQVARGQTVESPSTLFRNAKPSVVFIVGGDGNGNPTVQGSGFIVARDRIVTNHHVVAGAAKAIAVFSDGTSAPITSVIADSAPRDLIILGVATGTRPALPLGDELSLQQGDPVYAIGAPSGLEFTLTDGIVSAFRNMDDRFLIQSTAAIGHGSSGGPLLNREGKVVGITSALLSDTPGIYFSASIGDVKRLLRSPDLVVVDFSEWAKNNASTASASTPADPAALRTSEAIRIQKLINDKKYDEAKTAIQGLRVDAPDDSLTHLLTGELAQMTGDNKLALTELQLAVEKDPSNASSQFYYALALYYVRDFDDALAHEEKSHELSPTAGDIPVLAVMYYSVRNYKQAGIMAREALASDSKSEMALSVLAGLAFHGLSAQDESWPTVIQQLSNVNSDNFWVHMSQGYSDKKQSQIENAVLAFKAAEHDYFPDPAPYLALYSIYSDQADFGQANDQIRQGLLEIPDAAELLRQGVFASLMLRDATEASRRFDSLERLYPQSSSNQWTSCLYFYGIGQAARALPYCASVTEKFPDDRTAHSNYGWAALDAGEFHIAANEFSKAYKLASADWGKLTETQAVDLIWGMAVALYSVGDKKGTTELVRFIRKNHPSAATVTGLQQLPLLWSAASMQRIEAILRAYPK